MQHNLIMIICDSPSARIVPLVQHQMRCIDRLTILPSIPPCLLMACLLAIYLQGLIKQDQRTHAFFLG